MNARIATLTATAALALALAACNAPEPTEKAAAPETPATMDDPGMTADEPMAVPPGGSGTDTERGGVPGSSLQTTGESNPDGTVASPPNLPTSTPKTTPST